MLNTSKVAGFNIYAFVSVRLLSLTYLFDVVSTYICFMFSDFHILNHTMTLKSSNKRNDKEVGDSKNEKQKANCIMSNKKLFIYLVLEQRQLGNRSGKTFTAVGWENMANPSTEVLALYTILCNLEPIWSTWE